MELKQGEEEYTEQEIGLLIVPCGIETTDIEQFTVGERLLIVPCGIETGADTGLYTTKMIF